LSLKILNSGQTDHKLFDTMKNMSTEKVIIHKVWKSLH